jgi:hypothetical protein
MARFTERSRRKRIEGLIARLDRDQDIQKRDLDAVLSAEQREAFAAAWDEQKANRRPSKPAEITEYESLLAKADLADGKCESYSARGRVRSNVIIDRAARLRELRSAADTAYERALEHLQAILELDPSLCVWLDRDVDFTAKNAPSLAPPSMPRAVTSRSLNRLASVGDRFGEVLTKRDLKRRALQGALASLEWDGEDDELGEADRAKLGHLLGQIKRGR